MQMVALEGRLCGAFPLRCSLRRMQPLFRKMRRVPEKQGESILGSLYWNRGDGMPYIQLLRHREKAENLRRLPPTALFPVCQRPHSFGRRKCRTLKKNAGTIGTVKNYQNSDRQNDGGHSAGEEPFRCPLFLT